MSLAAGFNALVKTGDQPMLLLNDKGSLLGANAHARHHLSIIVDFPIGAPLSQWAMEYEDDSLDKQLTRWYRSRTPVLGMLKHLCNDDEFVSHDGSILSFRVAGIFNAEGYEACIKRIAAEIERMGREPFVLFVDQLDWEGAIEDGLAV